MNCMSKYTTNITRCSASPIVLFGTLERNHGRGMTASWIVNLWPTTTGAVNRSCDRMGLAVSALHPDVSAILIPYFVNAITGHNSSKTPQKGLNWRPVVKMKCAKASLLAAHRPPSPSGACGASHRGLGRLRRQLTRAARALRRLRRRFFFVGDCEKFAEIPHECSSPLPRSLVA